MNDIDKIINLPRDRATINAWARSWHMTNPDIYDQIELLKSKIIKRVESKYSVEDINNIIKELIVLGEVFIYTNDDGSFQILNPDYVVVKKLMNGDVVYYLRPDENMRRCVKNGEISGIEEKICECIRKDQNIPLNTYYIKHIKRSSAWEIRGTSMLVPYFKRFLLADKCEKEEDKDFKFLPDDDDYFESIIELYSSLINSALNKKETS